MNLYEFAATARRAILYGAIGLGALLILYLLARVAINLYLTINPPPEAPPTVGFGKLPPLNLPSLELEGEPTFRLETATGALPEFDDRASVVAFTPLQPTLLGEEKARDLAEELDFAGQGELSADKKFLAFRDEPDRRTLTVEISTQNFTLETDLARIAGLPKGKAPSPANAVKSAQDLLRRLGLLKFGFEGGTQTTAFRVVEGGEVREAGSISQAHFTEVSFFRNLTGTSSESLPMLPPDPKVGLIRFWLTTDLNPSVLNLLRLDLTLFELDKTKVETYPLREVADAWEEVQGGKGAAYVGVGGELKTVTITRVSLAYLDDSSPQDYLQPIFLFTGTARNAAGEEGEFIAYSRAISEEWVR